jgi:hypothetical protein
MIIGLVGNDQAVSEILKQHGFSVCSFRSCVLDGVEKAFNQAKGSIVNADATERLDALALSLVEDKAFRQWLGSEITDNVSVYCKSNSPNDLFGLWYDYKKESQAEYWSQALIKRIESTEGDVLVTGLCGQHEIDSLKAMGAELWMVPEELSDLSSGRLHDTEEFVQLFSDADSIFLSCGDDLAHEIKYKLEASQSPVRPRETDFL